jgi:putative membrane protein
MRIRIRPLEAWLAHGVVIWLWHVPVLFESTLRSNAMHALQHASFLGSALVFWSAIIRPRRRASLGLSIIYLFTTAVHTSVLGALMTFARTPWYAAYASTAAAWGLSPAEDQQLAGLIMWIPASAAYLIAALIVIRRWLADSEWAGRAQPAAVGS